MQTWKSIIILAALFACAACNQTKTDPGRKGDSTMKLTSPAFADKANIPPKFTCDGENISPALEISGVPARAKMLALIVDDPDAPSGTWTHWVIFNIKPDTTRIDENSAPGIQGSNSGKHNRYSGPCPPSGTHRYFFHLYALDQELGLKEGATKEEVLAAIEGHILAETELMGTYSRRK